MRRYRFDNRWSAANIRFQLYRAAVLPFKHAGSFPIGRAPVVIGGIGGSGTRVFVPILQQLGYWMGSWVSRETQDAMATRCLLERAFEPLVEGGSHPDPALVNRFSKLIAAHRLGMPEPTGPWGWKNPRSIWIIPFLSSLYSDLRFIHVVRDGRDMALSRNENLLRKHGTYLLQDPECARDSVRAKFKLWALGNRLARENGRKYLGENYILVSYDRLCLDPEGELTRLFTFLALRVELVALKTCSGLIQTSDRAGGWRQSQHPMLNEPEAPLREALALFGYD